MDDAWPYGAFSSLFMFGNVETGHAITDATGIGVGNAVCLDVAGVGVACFTHGEICMLTLSQASPQVALVAIAIGQGTLSIPPLVYLMWLRIMRCVKQECRLILATKPPGRR